MDTRTAGTGADADEARVLLEQALRYNEAEAASSRRVLDALVQDGAGDWTERSSTLMLQQADSKK